MSCKGVDKDGYIINMISVDNVSQRFKSVLEESIACLVKELGNNLHSIYLYGSVGRGTAVFGQSDLDLSVITYSDLSDSTKDNLNEIEVSLCRVNDCISKLEFDLGTLDEAMV